MTDMKMKDVMTDQMTGHESAGHDDDEISGHETAGYETSREAPALQIGPHFYPRDA